MAYSRNSSQDEYADRAPGRSSHTTSPTPWPLPDATLTEVSCAPRLPGPAKGPDRVSAQQALEGVIRNDEVRNEPPKRRMSSRLRLFTNSLPLLRRQGTGDTNVSPRNVSDTPSSTVNTTITAPDDTSENVNEDTVMAYLAKNSRKFVKSRSDAQMILNSLSGEKIKSFINRFTKHIPPPTDYDREVADAYVSGSPLALPTTLRAAIRLFPDVKVLTKDLQEVTVAIDIEGVLHNRKPLPETAIDVVFVVDNG
jgi:hypothetical protein